MCDYSLEGYATREAEVGDKLVINQHFHGFMSEGDSASLNEKLRTRTQLQLSDVCMTCLKEGTVLTLRAYGDVFRNARFTRIKTSGFRDHVITEGGAQWCVAGLPRGVTTAEVISIPGQKPKAPERSLDETLGLDKLDTTPVREREPSLAQRVVARLGQVLRPVTA